MIKRTLNTDNDPAAEGNPIPTSIIGDAVHQLIDQIQPQQTDTGKKIAAIVDEITEEHIRKSQESPAEIVHDLSHSFTIKQGQENELLAMFEKFQEKKSAGTPDGNEPIVRKAILWAHLMETEQANPTELSPKEIAAKTYDAVFEKGDAVKMRVPVKRFLEKHWDGNTEAAFEVIDAKVAESQRQTLQDKDRNLTQDTKSRW